MGILVLLPESMCAKKKDKPANEPGEITGAPVLWHEPADVASLNLLYGSGGDRHVPQGPMTFVQEDMEGTNPKFDVRDSDGVKWKLKLGAEAQPETVATRFLWAVGYFTNEDYFLPELQVNGLPEHVHRGQKWISANGTMHNVRLKRSGDGEKKIGTWEWRNNPFTGTRELNGLRVMMAVINNWDLKDLNNAIYRKKHKDEGKAPELRYAVSDLGASFGTTNFLPNHEKAKGNLSSYEKSKFITKVEGDQVDFDDPKAPAKIVAFNPKEYTSRLNIEWIGRHIARAIGEAFAAADPRCIPRRWLFAGRRGEFRRRVRIQDRGAESVVVR
jgi:hypothetical protein